MADRPQRSLSFKGYRDPLEIVDRTDIDYAERLAMLQEWQARLAHEDAPQNERKALLGAIQALEMGAAVQSDAPEDAPDGRGYGVHRTE